MLNATVADRFALVSAADPCAEDASHHVARMTRPLGDYGDLLHVVAIVETATGEDALRCAIYHAWEAEQVADSLRGATAAGAMERLRLYRPLPCDLG